MSTRRDMLDAEPWRFDFLALLCELERSTPGKPRIGHSAVLAEEIVSLGQDPFVEFPAANVTDFVQPATDARARLRARFLGFFGPQGALPLTTTQEALHWMQAHDDSFVRFTDIFADRFLQLFYRAWADARPLALFGRPEDDRFRAWVGSALGIGTPALADRDSIPDIAKLAYAGLLGSRVKSATRLAQGLRGLLGVDLRITERVASWLDFEPQDLTRLGQTGAVLGQSTHLGARVQSIMHKITVTIRTQSLDEYESFLPGQPRFCQIVDLLYFQIGHTVDVDIALELPKAACPAARLGAAGRLGWTAWSAPEAPANATAPPETGDYIVAATFAATARRA